MRLHWTQIGGVTLLAAAGCAVIYAGVQRSLRRIVAERQESTDRQIAALATTVKALEARVAGLKRLSAERNRAMPAIFASAAKDNGTAKDPIKPEMLAVITAAAATFLGKTARVRSVKLVPVQQAMSAWTNQGRMIVHASHNLRARD